MTRNNAIKSQRVVLPEGTRPATIHISDGRIERISEYADSSAEDYGNLAIIPGVIDPHVHFNEPGRTHWEGWESGTRAALAGGVTTVVEMPLNSIPSTVDQDSLKLKTDSTQGKLYCDVGLWGGAVPGNTKELKGLVEGGVLGLKCFLSDPGTEEFQNLDEGSLAQAMAEIAAIDSVLLIHAEWPSALLPVNTEHDPESYRAWLSTRPVKAEIEAVKKVAELSERTGCRCHIVHVSSPAVLEALKGTKLTCETCAHYLVFAAEEIENRSTNYKCAPPIRGRSERDGLWKSLEAGQIQMVTSDHSPCPPDMKNHSFTESWGGIAGVQMLLPATWTGAAERGIQLQQLAEWLCAAPAKLAGLWSSMGSIEVGKLANFAIFDPDAEFLCESLEHRHPGSPYEGKTWRGVVAATYLRGERAFYGGKIEAPAGRLL